VALAGRGARNLDSGEEKIEDAALAAALRKLAAKIHGRSLLAAALLTILCLVIFP